jgi:hypothetical protein
MSKSVRFLTLTMLIAFAAGSRTLAYGHDSAIGLQQSFYIVRLAPAELPAGDDHSASAI